MRPSSGTGTRPRRNRIAARDRSPRELETIFAAAGMTRVSLRALGLFVPPPYLQAFADRHAVLIDRLQRIEDRTAAWPVLRGWGDHFLVVLRKA